MADERYQKLAESLLAAPDPVVAVAHELGDQAGRLDALNERLRHVEAQVGSASIRRPGGFGDVPPLRPSNAGWQGATG